LQDGFHEVNIAMEEARKGALEELNEWPVRSKHYLWQCSERINIQGFQSNTVFSIITNGIIVVMNPTHAWITLHATG